MVYQNQIIMTLATITNRMNALEVEISRQQLYIAKFGEQNDKNSDTAWESYKESAALNLQMWEAMKVKRDQLKAQA